MAGGQRSSVTKNETHTHNTLSMCVYLTYACVGYIIIHGYIMAQLVYVFLFLHVDDYDDRHHQSTSPTTTTTTTTTTTKDHSKTQ